MIEVKPLKAEDVLYVIEHGIKEIGLWAIPNEDMKRHAEEREKSGRCFTGWVDGTVVGVGGVDLLWKGVADVWLMVTPYIDTHKLSGFKCIHEGLEKVMRDNGLWRVQSAGRIDYPQCHVLFKHLGFEAEGIARKYTADKMDCIIYAKVI